MSYLRGWWVDIWSYVVSIGCWFSVERCQCISSRVALIIGVLTLIFITLPNVYRRIKRLGRSIKKHRDRI